ncbi:helix-hairpin-helix domain-containing protein [Gordonia sp. NPDC003585]|uniref:helix-hairpin-helix domain-containing protein n=1 Tax=unclassified Gordonia (in: high G+C Gram-positive bacteria) TaxID=2657482 RepID=UPI00339ED522
MSTSGRRNPLDRLSPVGPSATTGRSLVGAPEVVPDTDSGPDTDSAPDADHVSETRWGIGAMPAWLDPVDGDHDGRGGSTAVRSPTLLDSEDDEDDAERIGSRRFAVAPPAALALLAIGVIACVVAGFGLFRGSDPPPAVAFEPTAGPSVPMTTSMPTAVPAPAQLVVSVVGLVHRPGLVRVPSGARVADAIETAGGPRQGADTVSLNLAQLLHDGDQVLVGYAGADGRALRSSVVPATRTDSASSATPGGGPTTPSATPGPESGARVNLNTATESELDALPGVGPVTARAIIDWRNKNGRFSNVDQLGEVDGIGPARLAKLRDLVTV